MKNKLAIYGGEPVRKKYLPYGSQFLDKTDLGAVLKTLKSDWLTQGPKIKEFEDALCKYTGAKYAVAIANGTAALHVACLAAGISPGDEVITSPLTFVASANCVLFCGAKPVFADIEEGTFNIDPDEIRGKITKNTKAIIPVDFAGHPCKLEQIADIARQNKLIVIEDACHALGSKYKNYRIGDCRYSDMTVFSFHPVKHITTAEGGAILTNNERYYDRLRLLRTHGITNDPKKMFKNEGKWYYEMQDLGYNYRITDIQCALGISQLAKLERFIKRRRQIIETYNRAFRRLGQVRTPIEDEDAFCNYHLYILLLDPERLKAGRRQIFDALRSENIGVHVHYIPVHLQPYYRNRLGHKQGEFPVAEDYYQRAITLPLFPAMSDEDVGDVIKAVKKVINYHSRKI